LHRGKRAAERGSDVQEMTHYAPDSVAAAVAALAHDGARALAGGTDLIPQLREGRRSTAHVVDLKQIPELKRLTRNVDGSWTIGAAVSVGELGRNPAFAREHAPVLEAARLIGSLQIQNRAGLGGNICNAAPSADGVPILLCLGAEADIVGPHGRRRCPVAAVGVAPGRTSLEPSEFLLSIHLPALAPRSGAKYLRFTPRREMDIAIAGVAAWFKCAADGTIADARIALASVAPTVMVAATASQQLLGQLPSDAIFAAAAAAAAAEARPISDARGSADYRRELVAVLTRRALAACAIQAGIQRA
jgi:xanthine dehydrogenase FAD-binding subunit